MQRYWFRPWGWVFRPVSPAGWMITLALVAACVWVFRAVDRNSHSASDTLINVFPYAALFTIIAVWVASHTAGSTDR